MQDQISSGRPRYCADCGADLQPGDAFCGRCGHATGVEIQPVPRQSPSRPETAAAIAPASSQPERPRGAPEHGKLGWASRVMLIAGWPVLWGGAWAGAFLGWTYVEALLSEGRLRWSPLLDVYFLNDIDDLIQAALKLATGGCVAGLATAFLSGRTVQWSPAALNAPRLITTAIAYAVLLMGASTGASMVMSRLVDGGLSYASASESYPIIDQGCWIAVSIIVGFVFCLKSPAPGGGARVGRALGAALGWGAMGFAGLALAARIST